MRLLNVDTMKICEFLEHKTPPYAILSHTWGKEEVSFSDMHEGRATGLQGYEKIKGCCAQAAQDGFEFVWIDTCCIDKRSSAELSEAINSMFRWYERANVCYAYLQDADGSYIEGSSWFKRGWTLQELIAPSIVVFYDRCWIRIGTRDGLSSSLSAITRIPEELFAHRNLGAFSIAQKMSWASCRSTTRVEDEAYCLLGLFGVSLPLIYGEGRNAFRRLQEEIIKRSDDQTIFAWTVIQQAKLRGIRGPEAPELDATPVTATGVPEPPPQMDGLLAISTSQFFESQDFVAAESADSPPYAITNQGLQISMHVIPSRKIKAPVNRLGLHIHLLNKTHTFGILNITKPDWDGLIALLLGPARPGGFRCVSPPDGRLIYLPRSYLVENAVRRRIYIRIQGRPERFFHGHHLVVIRPLANTLARIKFKRFLDSFDENPDRSRYTITWYQQGNGAISVTFPDRPIVGAELSAFVLFKTANGKTVIFGMLEDTDSSSKRFGLCICPEIVNSFRHAKEIFLRSAQRSIQLSDHNGDLATIGFRTQRLDHGLIVTLYIEKRTSNTPLSPSNTGALSKPRRRAMRKRIVLSPSKAITT